MKPIIDIKKMWLSTLLPIMAVNMSAQSADCNYIRVVEPLAGSVAEPSTDAELSRVGITYFDGLGREVQQVAVGQGGDGEDIVTLTEYDRYGNAYRDWLATPNQGNGAFVPPAEFATKAISFHGDQYPFTTTEYEESQLNRPMKQFAPGSDYHPHKRHRSYNYSTGGAVTMFKVGADGTTLRNAGVFGAGTLDCVSVTDEDGHETSTYTDRQGRTVLTRRHLSEGKTIDTYRVYDIYGDLRYMISPKAAELLTAEGECDTSVLERLCYYYEYDVAHRVTLKRLPGQAPVCYVYDRIGNLIFSQDGNQRDRDEWSVYKYDNRHRLAVRGHATIAGATRVSLQNAWGDSLLTESPAIDDGHETMLFYTDDSGPGGFTADVAYFYDNYNHWGDAAIPTDTDYPVNRSLSAQGLMTGTAVLENGVCMVSAIYYDHAGRVVQRSERDWFTNSHGYSVFTDYDFRGLVERDKSVSQLYAEGTVTESHSRERRYRYGNSDNPTSIEMRLDGGAWRQIAAYEYDGLDRAHALTLGDNADRVLYGYDLPGRLVSIASDNLTQRLIYGAAPSGYDVEDCYNGNLTASVTTFRRRQGAGIATATMGMGYRYDSLNRLTSAADYANSCYFSETYGYDSNGNILTLTRSYDDNIVQDMVTMLDGNRLTGVNDASYDDLLGEFPQIESGSYPDAMDYDAMGNLTRDDTRHISSITYHPVINMPQRLTFDNGSTITWGYRQDGLKYSSNERAKRLSVITTVNAAGDTITRTRVSYDSHTQRYIGDFVRIGNNRWRVYHESGHADILTSASGDTTVYRYYVRDYLGSTRAVLAEDGTLLQDANYYPGGLSFSQLNDTEETDRLHCGKEWVDMEGLGWYDNTARFHDAILCRFTTPDPLAEQYPDLSPYSHCANNPLTIVDPDGRDWIFAESTAEYSWRDDINATSKIPQGFQYVGATNNDIINHIGLNYKFQQLESNKLGMVASDAELGYYAVSHLVNVRAKTMVEIVANVTFEPNNRTDQNLSGRTFNGITIEVSQVTSNSPIDGEVVTGGKVTFDYGNATYSGYLGLPKKPVLHSSETSVKATSIDIPKNKLSTEYTLKKIQVSGNWFVSTPGGYTPIVYHSLMPIPLSYTHTWKLKK